VRPEHFAKLAEDSGSPEDAVDAWTAGALILRSDRENDESRYSPECLRKVIELAPDEPRTWALSLYQNWYALYWAVRSPDDEGTLTPMTADEYQRVEEAIGRGRSLEPANALWDVAAAALALYDRDGPSAEQALCGASERLYFRDYVEEFAEATAVCAGRLPLSPYSARVVAYQEVGIGGRDCWPEIARKLGRLFAGEAARLEEQGTVGEALTLDGAIIQLDRLMWWAPPSPSATSTEWRQRLPFSSQVWRQRYPKSLSGSASSEFASRGRGTQALDSFLSLAISYGRTDLALQASVAAQHIEEWKASADERRRSEPVLAYVASCSWWVELPTLALLAVWVAGAVGIRWLAMAVARAPERRGYRVAYGVAVSAALLLSCEAVRGLAMPGGGFGEVQVVTWLTRLRDLAGLAAPWVIAVLAGVLVVRLEARATRGCTTWAPKTRRALVCISRLLAWALAIGYAMLTLTQAALQAKCLPLLV